MRRLASFVVAAWAATVGPGFAQDWTFQDSMGCSMLVEGRNQTGADDTIVFRVAQGSDGYDHLDIWAGIGGVAGAGMFGEYLEQSVTVAVDGNPALRFQTAAPDIETTDGGFRGLRIDGQAADVFLQWMAAGSSFVLNAQTRRLTPSVREGESNTLSNLIAAADRGDFREVNDSVTFNGSLTGSRDVIEQFLLCAGVRQAPQCGPEPRLSGLASKPNWNGRNLYEEGGLRRLIGDYGDACVESEQLMSAFNGSVSRCVREPGFSRNDCEFLDVMARSCRSDYQILRQYYDAQTQWRSCQG